MDGIGKQPKRKGVIMENKRTFIVQIVTLFLVIISWFVIPCITENKRKQAEIEIWQHTAMSDAHRNLATAFIELQAYTTKLASLRKCNVKDVLSEMSKEEFNTANSFVRQMNTALAIMYMIMTNDKYEAIHYAIKPGQEINLIEQNKKLLAAMRKSQVPDANFVKPEDIRSFDYLKKPIKKATD